MEVTRTYDTTAEDLWEALTDPVRLPRWFLPVSGDLRLGAGEALIAGEGGPFCFGSTPTIADLCLVPQLANARRFGVDVSAYPRLLRAEAAARENKAFADAAPDKQPDAE